MLLEKLVISWRKKRESRHERQTERERLFLDNGSKVLEELVATCNGKHTPIRSFSYEELRLATDNFDDHRVLHDHPMEYPTWYKGSLDDRTFSIKYENCGIKTVVTDIAISAKVSAHKNVLKLVGCCLETQPPTLVYESANGILADRIYVIKDDGIRKECQPIAWQSRLKIAREIAHAVAYLHNAFSRPIIHRDINLGNILLNQHDVPKLTGFWVSISIPEGETYVEDSLCGTAGYICPSYYATGRVTEKTDVYSFGMLLLEILTSQYPLDCRATSADDEGDPSFVNYLRTRAISEIVDPALMVDGSESGVIGREEQLQSVLQLALTCLDEDPEIRPTMIDVTEELRRIEMFVS
ncbi:serine/threonine-protein kinase ZRK1-like [Juglans microcarpa x Juglans regia]|uniref:serine/threonine-protein kinase ZRK1-like n=1 Tax=Juglans microcarpa x Juglans regia TaxID=2249226 RepID=UPI001B7E46D7|nr:serine/threonine-protein kinase ZRK1-like [Juglans microcarpa x Juglans regia]